MNVRLRSRILFIVGSVISLMLLGNLALMYYNSGVIEENRTLQFDAEKAKVNTLDIIRNLHLLDIGLRGYALTRNDQLLSAYDSANMHRERIFARLHDALAHQRFPHMDSLRAMEQSVAEYFQVADTMLFLAKSGRDAEFKKLLNEDRGLYTWQHFKRFSKLVNDFENNISADASVKYQQAVRNTYLLQILLCVLAIPVLIYMAYFSAKTFMFSDQLRSMQEERNRMLREQNDRLDMLVKQKTEDILTQNEEITAQNEEIRAHNDQLVLQQEQIQKAQRIIEEQSIIIHRKNEELTREVARQTTDLRATNSELVAQNSRLQQFTYIISHNLRAPLARLKGLANVLGGSTDIAEKEQIFQYMVQSSNDLETVISDLSTILNVQRSHTLVKSDVHLYDVIHRVIESLQTEIQQTRASVTLRLEENVVVASFGPYAESIFYNLISNAIKYRNPEKDLEVMITGRVSSRFFCVIVKDNGLGIDLASHGATIFNLYKRFHFHVEGKGLGLYLVKTQIEALGGHIEVFSTPYEGTQFHVYFPIESIE